MNKAPKKTDGALLVFDWDGVIFDTKLFGMVRNRVFKRFGYQDDRIRLTSQKAKESREGYNFHSHAKLLTRGAKHEHATIAKAIYDEIEKHPGTFVFADAKKILASLKKEKRHSDILTAGHKEFQEYKIIRSGLRHLFRNIHIAKTGPRVPQYKFSILRKLAADHDRLIFLDDRADTIEAIKRSTALRGRVLPILVWRGKEKPPTGLLMVRSLSWKDIQKIAIRNGFEP